MDPSGFQVQEVPQQDAIVTWPDGKPITVYVVGEPRKKEPPKESAEDEATLPPTDLGVIGNTAGVVPEQPPTSSELPRSGGDIALDVGLGIADGLFDFGAGIGTTLLLNALTLGGYSTYQFGAAMWKGYREGGIIGAINEVNPFYQIGKAGAQSYLAFVGGDYHEGANKGITAAVLAAVTVVGIVQGVGALAGKPPPPGVGAVEKGPTGAPIQGVTDVKLPRARFPETAQHAQDAQAAGHPSVLTIDRGGAIPRRGDALKGRSKVAGKDLDEYPPAMFREGGKGASVRPVTPGDNKGAGACIGAQCRGLPDGAKVRIIVE